MEVARPSRRERSAETRRKMLDAAVARFTSAGYDGTTMAAIAKQAGVAVQCHLGYGATAAERSPGGEGPGW